jgi:hypothetical protein
MSCADAAVIQQRIALARGAVADDRLAAFFRSISNDENLALGRLHLLGEVLVGLQILSKPMRQLARAQTDRRALGYVGFELSSVWRP